MTGFAKIRHNSTGTEIQFNKATCTWCEIRPYYFVSQTSTLYPFLYYHEHTMVAFCSNV